ncbi:MAG: hypothetical protein LBD94_03005 [Rickettsiales bacterium]|nr:hypothetical protein [Rickettsiales bacterium]
MYKRNIDLNKINPYDCRPKRTTGIIAQIPENPPTDEEIIESVVKDLSNNLGPFRNRGKSREG